MNCRKRLMTSSYLVGACTGRSPGFSPNPASSSSAATLRPDALPGSALQLTLEFIEEPPIRGLGDELVGVRLDHASFAQPKRPEPDRVLGIVLPPLVVWNLFQRLKRIIVLSGEAAIDHAPCRPRRIADAEIGRLEAGAQHALGGDRIPSDEVPVAGQHAAIVLRPWTIDRAIDDHMADLAGAQLLRFGRKAEPRIDLSVSEKLHGRDRWAPHPVDVLGGVKPDMGGHARHEDV